MQALASCISSIYSQTHPWLQSAKQPPTSSVLLIQHLRHRGGLIGLKKTFICTFIPVYNYLHNVLRN